MEAVYQITGDFGGEVHAGPKAIRDIARVLDRIGVLTIDVRRTAYAGAFGRMLNRLLWLLKCQLQKFRLPRNATLFMVYPNAAFSENPVLCLLNEKVKSKRNLKLVTYITDLRSFHWSADVAERSSANLLARRLEGGEERLCTLFDKIIVHNEAMLGLLLECGVPRVKLVSGEILDYLTSVQAPSPMESNFRDVIYAGNLVISKSPFVSTLKEVVDCRFRLFGPGCPDDARSDNVIYEGVFPPEELPSHLTGGFGLVWDGASLDEVAGPIGKYYRFITPHKLSLYLASGLPVFIWDQCGEAEFVVKNKVGFAVSTLHEVGGILNKLTFDEYTEIRRNVLAVSERIRAGHYTKAALEKCLAP